MQKLTFALAVSVLALVACPAEDKVGGETTPPGAPASTMTPPMPTPASVHTPAAVLDPKAEAEQIFSQRCTVCHGMSGRGDGAAAATLNPKPRDYSDAAWQKTIDDASIAKVIVEGGPSIGKSPLMVGNADLKDKPEVVKALVAKVRSFGGAGAGGAGGAGGGAGGAGGAPGAPGGTK